MKKNKLKVLSVHTSNKCSVNCPFCYLDKSHTDDEMTHNWWLDFFNQLDNIEQLALAWNEQPIDHMCEYIEIAGSKNIIVNLTCNPKMITPFVAQELSKTKIKMVSLSVDRFKCKNIDSIKQPTKVLKDNNIFIGINLLLDFDIIQHLDIVIQKLLYSGVDMVYALHPKPDNLQIDIDTLKKNIMLCSALYPQKFSIDQSIKLKFGKISTCGRGKELLSVNSHGQLCLCSFDKPMKDFDGQIEPIDTITTFCPFL